MKSTKAHRSHSFLVAVSVVLVGLALGGCSSSGQSNGAGLTSSSMATGPQPNGAQKLTQAQKAVSVAYRALQEANSVHMTLSGTVTVQLTGSSSSASAGPLVMTISGSGDATEKPRAAELSMSITGSDTSQASGGPTISMSEDTILYQNTLYMRLELPQAPEVSGSWYSLPLPSSPTDFQTQLNKLGDLFGTLSSILGQPIRDLGETRVNGALVHQYAVTLNIGGMALTSTVSVDPTTKRISELSFQLSGSIGDTQLNGSLDMRLTDYGERVEIQPPPPDEVKPLPSMGTLPGFGG